MSYDTNGYLAALLANAAKDQTHADSADASLYITKFRDLEKTFFEEVHPQVDIGLAVSEVQLAGRKKPHIFTIHGCRHISDLIKSLDKLARTVSEEPGPTLTILESYILLCAAHVHDAANAKKRASHPERCDELLQEYKHLFASPAVVQQVFNVASVHGGSHPVYGKDTIRSLDLDNSESPRIPLLAALLRIGDELSENPERVPDLVEKSHDHSDESKLAFAYARSFTKFEFRKDNLFLTYGVYPDQAAFSGTVKKVRVTFFQFLEAKLDVIDRESRYCSQYGRPAFSVGRINVTILLYEKALPSPVKEKLAFSWPLLDGYPGDSDPIWLRSPELKGKGVRSLAECFVSGEPQSMGPVAKLQRYIKERASKK